TRLYIGSEWREASGGKRFDVVDPASEQVIAQVADGTVEDAQAAVDAAAVAQPAWAVRPPRERAEILRKAFDLLTAAENRLARLIVRENGKALPDAIGEMRYAAEFFRWFSEEAVRNLGTVSVAPASGARILVQHK